MSKNNYNSRVSTKFKIDKEKGVVVCIIAAKNDIYTILKKYGLEKACYKYNMQEYFPIEKFYKGIARCSPKDEWDENYGRRLAEYRAMRTRQTEVNNELKNFIKNIFKRTNDLSIYGLLKTPNKPKEKE